eukprot:1453104-Rhodomonas_salina.1
MALTGFPASSTLKSSALITTIRSCPGTGPAAAGMAVRLCGFTDSVAAEDFQVSLDPALITSSCNHPNQLQSRGRPRLAEREGPGYFECDAVAASTEVSKFAKCVRDNLRTTTVTF